MTRIDGFSDFVEELKDLSEGLRDVADEIGSAVGGGTEQTAQDVRDTARRKAPVESGELKRKIAVQEADDGTYTVVARADHAAHVEYGTQPHLITPDTKEVLKFQSGTDTVYTAFANHPGTEAQPFLRPALKQHQSSLTRNITSEIKKLINTYI